MKLNKVQRRLVFRSIDDLFFKQAARTLGRFFPGSHLYISLTNKEDPTSSLEWIYKYTSQTLFGPQVNINDDELERLADISYTYFDTERLRTRNAVFHAIEKAPDEDALNQSISSIIDSAYAKINTITTTEMNNAATQAEFSGIGKVAAASGDADPTVVKLSTKDIKLCPQCVGLWCSDSNIYIPKPYKLSELQAGYSSAKNPIPTVNATHPHCRCRMIYVPMSFGFTSAGKLDYISLDYDFYADQRGQMQKSEKTPLKWEQFRDITGKDPHTCTEACTHNL